MAVLAPALRACLSCAIPAAQAYRQAQTGSLIQSAAARALLWAAVDVPYALEQRFMGAVLKEPVFQPLTLAQLADIATFAPRSFDGPAVAVTKVAAKASPLSPILHITATKIAHSEL